jgi:hypothetical protein
MAHLLGKHRRTKVVWQRYTVMNSNLAFVRGRDFQPWCFLLVLFSPPFTLSARSAASAIESSRGDRNTFERLGLYTSDHGEDSQSSHQAKVRKVNGLLPTPATPALHPKAADLPTRQNLQVFDKFQTSF